MICFRLPPIKYAFYLLTGELGRYMFKVATGRHDVNYDQKCLSWFANEMKRILLTQNYWWSTPICPCDLRLALMDARWRFNWKQYYETNFERRCIYESTTYGQSTQVEKQSAHTYTNKQTNKKTNKQMHARTFTNFSKLGL